MLESCNAITPMGTSPLPPADSSPTVPIARWQTYRRLWVYIRPYLKPLSLVVLVSLGATALTLFQPYFSKLLIDRALLRRDMHALVWIAGLMSVASVLGFAFNIVASYRYVRVSASMLFDMRLALFRHLQTLSPRFYAGYRLGDLMSRLNNDVGEVQRVSADALLSVLSNVGFLIGAVAMMLWLNWRLFLVGVVLIPACIYTLSDINEFSRHSPGGCGNAVRTWAVSSWTPSSACESWSLSTRGITRRRALRSGTMLTCGPCWMFRSLPS